MLREAERDRDTMETKRWIETETESAKVQFTLKRETDRNREREKIP